VAGIYSHAREKSQVGYVPPGPHKVLVQIVVDIRFSED
jgi:hypothetical protein